MFVVVKFANGYSGRKVKGSRVWALEHWAELVERGELIHRAQDGRFNSYQLNDYHISKLGFDSDPIALFSLKPNEFMEAFQPYMSFSFVRELAEQSRGYQSSGGRGLFVKATCTMLNKHFNLGAI